MTGRASWDDYFLTIARQVATRATCATRQVGAVIVQDRTIVSTGYNGGPSGMPHCIDGACPRAARGLPTGQGYDGCIAIHAEANAIMFARPEGRKGATLYVTTHPCFGCAKLVANSGVVRVVAGGTWPGVVKVSHFLVMAGVQVDLASDVA